MNQSRQTERDDASRYGASRPMSDSSSGSTASGSASGDPAGRGQDAFGQAQVQAEKMVNTARERATSQLSSQKERAAGGLEALASALQDTGRQMRSQDDAVMADYIETAANQVDHLAVLLKNQDVDQLIAATERFARRQPALFLAAAFAVGFAGTRFLKSSSSGKWVGGNGYGSSRDQTDWQRVGSPGSAENVASGQITGATDRVGLAGSSSSGARGDWEMRTSATPGLGGR
jgi:hypothetical protein